MVVKCTTGMTGWVLGAGLWLADAATRAEVEAQMAEEAAHIATLVVGAVVMTIDDWS